MQKRLKKFLALTLLTSIFGIWSAASANIASDITKVSANGDRPVDCRPRPKCFDD
jgi:hypothetical protein